MISADLGNQLESYIRQLVDTGRYGSKSEVLREGVRLVQDRETRLLDQGRGPDACVGENRSPRCD
ncbi:hypothetical protein B5M44_24470 [Shinella sumterensis]|nr:hypothetical protein B5M44_24470 [Shinella sumterensis]